MNLMLGFRDLIFQIFLPQVPVSMKQLSCIGTVFSPIQTDFNIPMLFVGYMGNLSESERKG